MVQDAADRAMGRAVALGERGRRTAPPNPWVGCVVVCNGEIVGEGFHAAPGRPHAEIEALADAGSRARRATAYVTLEPCAHRGRTGPCVDALVDAGVRRVVVALEDPDAQVRGRGIARLRERGVEVEVGTGAAEAEASLAPYLHHRRTGRAYCVLKTALSVDGRVAAANGSSRWITGRAARADAHRLRAESQAVLVGSGTALADRPELTARDVVPPVDRQPLRVLLDARGRVPAEGPLFDTAVAPTLVLTSDQAPAVAVDAWRDAGAKVETLPVAPTGVGVDLGQALGRLGGEGVLQALVEGGPTLHGALLESALADWLIAYIGPTWLGRDGRPAFDRSGPSTIATASRFELVTVTRLGEDVRLEYSPAGRT
jgi:diaminohydroxyphosphoribosylaminopyrimidine deaminase/5-amino-6-(5-phosphoribosylamino)uracil reductase